MNSFQLFALLLSVFFFVFKSVMTYFNNIGKPFSERLPVGETVDSLMISAIFGFTISFSASTWPDLKDKLDYMQDVHLSDPLYKAFKKAADARVALDQIQDDTTRKVVETNWRQSTAAYIHDLDFLNQGKVEVSHDQVLRFANAVFGLARNNVKATSFVDQVSWWSGPEGIIYKSRNEEALRRGISISRIFICKNEGELDALKPILNAQSKAGVQVYTLLEREIPDGLDKDIIVLDDKVVGELLIDDADRHFKDLYLNWGFSEVQRVAGAWGDLSKLAHIYKPDGIALNATK